MLEITFCIRKRIYWRNINIIALLLTELSLIKFVDNVKRSCKIAKIQNLKIFVNKKNYKSCYALINNKLERLKPAVKLKAQPIKGLINRREELKVIIVNK